MPKIYIANTTLHNHEFHYRLPLKWNENGIPSEWGDAKAEIVPHGSQVALASGRSFSEKEIEALLRHYAKFGIIRAGEYRKGFRGLVYSLDRPVTLDAIQEGIEHNREAAEQRSEKMLEDTAAANLRHQLEFARKSGTKAPERSELEIVEEPKVGDPSLARGAEALADGVSPKRTRA